MAKKLVTSVFVIVLILLSASPALAAKTYQAERFDVQLDLQPGGGMLVTETVAFRFDGGPFTYAFREISSHGTDGLTFLDASMDGSLMQPGTGAGQVEVTGGDPLKVTWHFPASSDTTHVFTVRYQVAGVIRSGQADTLIWYAIPPDHGYPITTSTITLNYAPGVQPLEAPWLDRTSDASATSSGIKLTTSSIGDNDSVILTARFPTGSLVSAAPRWQQSEQAAAATSARALPAGFFSGLAALLLGAVWLFVTIRANRRELNLPAQSLSPYPPEELPPAVAGKLTSGSSDSLGTIFDLAQRGLLVVREEKGFLGSTKHILEYIPNTDTALAPHEQALLGAVFKPDQTTVNLSEIGTRLSGKTSLIDQPLEQELVQRGWIDLARKHKKSSLVWGGVLFLVGGGIVFTICLIGAVTSLAGSEPFALMAAALAGLGAAATVFSIAWLAYAGTFSVLTPAGEQQKALWNNFKAYLDQVVRGREPVLRADTFEHYLAYAAVFGLGTRWAKYFQQLGGVPLPVWFRAKAGSEGDFGAMVAFMSASESSASAGGAGGGGGASGGGSSGAG